MGSQTQNGPATNFEPLLGDRELCTTGKDFNPSIVSGAFFGQNNWNLEEVKVSDMGKDLLLQ